MIDTPYRLPEQGVTPELVAAAVQSPAGFRTVSLPELEPLLEHDYPLYLTTGVFPAPPAEMLPKLGPWAARLRPRLAASAAPPNVRTRTRSARGRAPRVAFPRIAP